MSIGKWHLLTNEVLNEFIEHIEEEIFPDASYYIKDYQNQIEHENNPKEKIEELARILNYFKEKFIRFFPDYASFPNTEIDYQNQRVKIKASDLNSYFETVNLFNTDANDLVITNIDDEERNIIELDNLGALIKLLRIKVDESEYHCKYYHIIDVFTDVVIYNELRRCFSNSISSTENVLTPTQSETKSNLLREELGKYGFYELPMIKQLSDRSKQKLIELVIQKGLPYSIAMFEFLGFLKHIKNEHFKTKYQLNKEVAKWFNSDKEGRAVKGNISSLSDYSKENKNKYTAYIHKDAVKNDYKKLK